MQIFLETKTMREALIIAAAILLVPQVTSATDFGTFETFFGFNLVRFRPNSLFSPSFNALGGDSQFAYNFNSYISCVIDVGAVTKGELNHVKADTTVVNFVVGPQFKYHGASRFQPFVHMLFGGAYSTASTEFSLPSAAAMAPPAGSTVNSNSPMSARLVVSTTGFAMLSGGGFDIRISKHVAFRPFGVDYYVARLPGQLTHNPQFVDNFRYSAGVNFMFGPQ